jgi:hypothetical protein
MFDFLFRQGVRELLSGADIWYDGQNDFTVILWKG